MFIRSSASTRRLPWLVAMALVWVTLAPHLAQAVLMQSGRAGWEVCTSTGLLLVAPDDAGQANGLDEGQPPAHADASSCEWSVHMGGLAGLLPPSFMAVMLGLPAVRWLGLGVAAFIPGARWPMAQPRAPPVAS